MNVNNEFPEIYSKKNSDIGGSFLSGNGNLAVVLGGGPTAVANDCLLGLLGEAREIDKIDNLLGAVHGIEGILDNNLANLDPRAGERFSGFGPGAFLGSCRRGILKDDYKRILRFFKENRVRYAVFMGGDGTMSLLRKLDYSSRRAGMDVNLVGVPMTVDNDVKGTDHCLGYGSAARFYATSVLEVGIDARSLPPPVTVFETMGRDSGWLAASTILARETEKDPPHLVLLPEYLFDEEKFLEDVLTIYRDLGYVVVVASEGLKGAGEDSFSEEEGPNRDEFGHPLYGGVGRYLCHLISSRLGLRARDEKPGLLARCCMLLVSKTDRYEAFEVGREAAEFATGESSSGMVSLKRKDNGYTCETELTPLSGLNEGPRMVPDRFISRKDRQLSQSFKEYVRPLIGPPLTRFRDAGIDL